MSHLEDFVLVKNSLKGAVTSEELYGKRGDWAEGIRKESKDFGGHEPKAAAEEAGQGEGTDGFLG